MIKWRWLFILKLYTIDRYFKQMCCKYTHICMYVRTYNNKLSNNKNDVSIALLLKLISIAVSATNRQWFINLCDAAPQSSHNHLQLTIVIIIPSIRHFVLILRGCAKRLKLMRTQCSTDFHKRIYASCGFKFFLWRQYTWTLQDRRIWRYIR